MIVGKFFILSKALKCECKEKKFNIFEVESIEGQNGEFALLWVYGKDLSGNPRVLMPFDRICNEALIFDSIKEIFSFLEDTLGWEFYDKLEEEAD